MNGAQRLIKQAEELQLTSKAHNECMAALVKALTGSLRLADLEMESARATIERIANRDYRGNRPTEVQMAQAWIEAHPR
jgi:Xaa-Pro aminopeptidase